MKLKRVPEDFQVEELPEVVSGTQGRFGFYRLTKRGIGTLEAIEAIRRRWNLASSQVQHGGLKDRHAVTTQYLTILGGPDRRLHQSSFDLEPLGRLNHPYGPSSFRGNRFSIVLRALSEPELASAVAALEQVSNDGLPNYFDDQRFGSVGFEGDFVARAWLRGDHERALWLAIAAPNRSDRPGTRNEKAILQSCWGHWAEAKARLERSHARSIVTYLVDHPDDFRGAFARLRRDLRSLYFSAYQSYLWNLLLGHWITHVTRPEQRVPLAFLVAELPIQRGLGPSQAETLSQLRLPLPSARNPKPTGAIGERVQEILDEEGLTWEALRVRHLKDVFFSKGQRPALFFPKDLSHESGEDELYPGRQKLRIQFELPKGAYATLVVKRITDAA